MDMKIRVVPVTYNGTTPPVAENAQTLEDFSEWVDQKAASTVGHMVPKKKTDW